MNSQIIITTHSSHILNSKIHSNNTFNNICYLYEDKRNAAVANLNNKIVMPNEHEDEESEAFKFLKKHIKYKVSELFFSDAAIFVEGFAEDMIIPYYIEKMEGLRKHYISIFNINGAHGFLYKRLIEALGIPVLIITDLDIKRNEESDGADKQEGKKAKTYEQISCLADKETTNATIIDIYGKAEISAIPVHIENTKLILLRKYGSKGEPVFIEEILDEMKKTYPHKSEEASKILNEYHEIINMQIEQILADGTKLNLYQTIEDVMYGLYLHADANRIQRLVQTDEQLRFTCIRKYVEDFEKVLFKIIKCLRECGMDVEEIHKEHRLFLLSKEDAINTVFEKLGVLFRLILSASHNNVMEYIKEKVKTNAVNISEIDFIQESLKWICRWSSKYCAEQSENKVKISAEEIYELMGMAYSYEQLYRMWQLHNKQIVKFRQFGNCSCSVRDIDIYVRILSKKSTHYRALSVRGGACLAPTGA